MGGGRGRPPGPTVTAAVIARDEADYIAGCLVTLRWADEVLVLVDDRTRDATAELARVWGARVVVGPFAGFPQRRNEALALAEGDWVLLVDADERVPPSLAAEVRRFATGEPDAAGAWIPRRNVILGAWVRHAGWWPDRQLRLLRRGHARYDESGLVHEVAALDGPAATLSEPLLHLNYETLGEFREKQERYALLEARTLAASGARVRARALVGQPARELGRRLFGAGGYREGWLGLCLAAEMARARHLTYRELLRLQRAGSSGRGGST